MKKIWILGDGGFAPEALYWTKQTLDCGGEPYSIKGFITGIITDAPSVLSRLSSEFASTCVVKTIKEFKPSDEDFFVCGIGHSYIKSREIPPLLQREFRFLTIIHPTAFISANVQIGEGSLICPRVFIAPNVCVDTFSMLNLSSVLEHDSSLGAFSTLSPLSGAMGFSRIGDRTFIGASAIINPGITIGNDCIVGSGSVVVKNVPDTSTVAGNPARPITHR